MYAADLTTKQAGKLLLGLEWKQENKDKIR